MKLIFLIINCCIFCHSFADGWRFRSSFKSDNGLFELRISEISFSHEVGLKDSIYNSRKDLYDIIGYPPSNKYLWSLFDLRTNEIIYSMQEDSIYIGAMSVRISNDGKNIIVIDDFSSGYGFPNFNVVYFYKFGSLIKTLSLGDILDNMCCLSFSVSHMMWCSSFGISSNNEFFFQTYDFYKHTYTIDGAYISKESDTEIQDNYDVIVAEINRLARNEYHFKILKNIRGAYVKGQEMDITISDKTMRKIHGKFYGLFPRPIKRLENGFGRTIILHDSVPIKTDIQFPIYNGDNNCNDN